MVAGSSSSSSSSVSSLTSFGGLSDDAVRGPVVKFLCSYGGKILPRHPDGRLRYVGGDTRVLAVDRAVSFSELAVKMVELCGWGVPVSLRCQLPTEDLDALVSITSDEDLVNLLEEYDLASRDRDSPLKVRAFLSPLQQQQHHHQHQPAPAKAPATPPSSAARGKSPFLPRAADRCAHHLHSHQPQQFPASSSRLPTRLPTAVCYGQHHHYRHDHQRRPCVIHGGVAGGGATATSYRYHNHQQHPHPIHHGNHWQ